MIRQATESDIIFCKAINEVSMPEHYTDETWLSFVYRYSEYFLVYDDNGIKGYTLGMPVSHFQMYYYYTHYKTVPPDLIKDKSLSKRGSFLISIAVHPNSRGCGIGSNLLKSFINVSKKNDATFVFLTVRKSNQPALRLYEKFGFKRSAIVKKYYSDGESAVFMLLPVQESLK